MKHVLTFILSVTLCACGSENADNAPSGPIRIAVLPDQSSDKLSSQYTPLIDYLEGATSLEMELVLPLDYADLLVQWDTGRVDLAWFGGLTFIQAEQTSQAKPLVFRDVDLEFTSCYLAAASDTRSTVRDFKDVNFSFGPTLSTSGHLMPQYFMTEAGLDPEQYFATVRHSSRHDQTAEWVADELVTLGVANCVIVRSLFDSGKLSRDEVRIVETTPPYSDYVWATRYAMDERIRLSLLDAFLSLDASDPKHRELLRLQDANVYLPAGRKNFKLVRQAAGQAGLLVEESKN